MADPRQLQAQLQNAEENRLDALEEAECAAEERDGYRLELARVRVRCRELESALRTERHEHTETRQQLEAARRCLSRDAERIVELSRELELLRASLPPSLPNGGSR